MLSFGERLRRLFPDEHFVEVVVPVRFADPIQACAELLHSNLQRLPRIAPVCLGRGVLVA